MTNANEDIEESELFARLDAWDGTDEGLDEGDVDYLASLLEDEAQDHGIAPDDLYDDEVYDDEQGRLRRALAALSRHAANGGDYAKEQSAETLQKLLGMFSAAGRRAGIAGRRTGDVLGHLGKLVSRYQRPLARLAGNLGASSYSIGVGIPAGVSLSLSFEAE